MAAGAEALELHLGRLAALRVAGDGDGANGGVADVGLLGYLDVRPRALLNTFDRGTTGKKSV